MKPVSTPTFAPVDVHLVGVGVAAETGVGLVEGHAAAAC